MAARDAGRQQVAQRCGYCHGLLLVAQGCVATARLSPLHIDELKKSLLLQQRRICFQPPSIKRCHGKLRNGRMHAVLRIQKAVRLPAVHHQALHEAACEASGGCALRLHGGAELLGVANKQHAFRTTG